MKYILLVIFVISLSCKTTKNSIKEVEKLSNDYQVEKMENSKTKLTTKPTINLDFDKNIISGNAGCNRYSGTIITEGNNIKFERIVATKMYCQNMNIENEFMQKLGSIRTFKVVNTKFLLYNKANELLLTCVAK